VIRNAFEFGTLPAENVTLWALGVGRNHLRRKPEKGTPALACWKPIIALDPIIHVSLQTFEFTRFLTVSIDLLTRSGGRTSLFALVLHKEGKPVDGHKCISLVSEHHWH